MVTAEQYLLCTLTLSIGIVIYFLSPVKIILFKVEINHNMSIYEVDVIEYYNKSCF